MPLATLADVKAGLMISPAFAGSADDAALERAMAAAESFVDAHCGRSFAGGAFTEFHPAGRDAVLVRNFPLAAVESVHVDPLRQFGADTLLSADRYVVHPERGAVVSAAGPFLLPRPRWPGGDWPGAVRVAYTAPDDAVPPAVAEAFAQLVGHWYKQARTLADMEYKVATQTGSESTGLTAYPYALATGMKLPPGVLALLAPFRVPTV